MSNTEINRFHRGKLGVVQRSRLGVRGLGPLYVGGRFTKAGGSEGVDAYRIARWDGQWNALGDGLGLVGESATVCQCIMAVSNTELLAGGVIYEAGGLPIVGTPRWNGEAWSEEIMPLGNVTEVAFTEWNHRPVMVHQGGAVYTRDDVDDWRQLGATSMFVRRTLFVYAGEQPDYPDGILLCGGHPLTNPPNSPVMYYNSAGEYWGNLPYGMLGGGAGAYSFAVLDGRLVVGGSFFGGDYQGVAIWNAANEPDPWEALNPADWASSSLDGTVYAIIVWAGDLYAAGNFSATYDGSVALANIARWDATALQWRPLDEGFPYIETYANCMCIWNNALVVGGTFRPDPDFPTDSKWGVAAWNGRNWNNLDGGMRDPDNVLTGHHVFSVYARPA